MRNPFRETLLKYYLGYEMQWCPYMPTCRESANHPRCAYPYYKVCRIYQMRRLAGMRG